MFALRLPSLVVLLFGTNVLCAFPAGQVVGVKGSTPRVYVVMDWMNHGNYTVARLMPHGERPEAAHISISHNNVSTDVLLQVYTVPPDDVVSTESPPLQPAEFTKLHDTIILYRNLVRLGSLHKVISEMFTKKKDIGYVQADEESDPILKQGHITLADQNKDLAYGHKRKCESLDREVKLLRMPNFERSQQAEQAIYDARQLRHILSNIPDDKDQTAFEWKYSMAARHSKRSLELSNRSDVSLDVARRTGGW